MIKPVAVGVKKVPASKVQADTAANVKNTSKKSITASSSVESSKQSAGKQKKGIPAPQSKEPFSPMVSTPPLKSSVAVLKSSTPTPLKVVPEKHEFKQVETTSRDEVPQEVVDPGFLKSDEVFDEADHAQWQQLREQAAIHARAINLNKPETHPDFDGENCIECGDAIPPARLKWFKVRCVDCQNDLENQNRLNNRHVAGRTGGGPMFDSE